MLLSLLCSSLLPLWSLGEAASINRRASPPGVSFSAADGSSNGLPVLKLPYVTHRANEFDQVNDIYVWKNIRFAEPPTGNLRWAPPQPPSNISGVQDGKNGLSCFQAVPSKGLIAVANLLTLDPNQGEDCLNLDLYVPGAAIRGEASNLPVMSWIYGGGYTFGSKDVPYSGKPILASAKNKVIYMSMNYRLGAFGFLAGDQLMTSTSTANAGLLDQRAALQWVKSYISLVGGDPSIVTAFGESAGGGSIEHHITAQNGQSDPLFTSAVIQSPAIFPALSEDRLTQQFNSFANASGCLSPGSGTQLSCLRAASATTLQTANKNLLNAAPIGSFLYGPQRDGHYILDRPSSALAKGNFAKNVTMLVAHNTNEGLLFTDTSITTDSQATTTFRNTFPNATESTIQTMISLYPAPGTAGAPGAYSASSNFDRVSQWTAESVITCNTRYLASAASSVNPSSAYFYLFGVIPGVHAEDIILTFFPLLDLANFGIPNVNLPTLPPNLASGFQSYITSMGISGDPNTNRQKLVLPPTVDISPVVVGEGGLSGIQVTLAGFAPIQSDQGTTKTRCDFWQSGVAFGP